MKGMVQHTAVLGSLMSIVVVIFAAMVICTDDQLAQFGKAFNGMGGKYIQIGFIIIFLIGVLRS
jgi:hypothetical protein